MLKGQLKIYAIAGLSAVAVAIPVGIHMANQPRQLNAETLEQVRAQLAEHYNIPVTECRPTDPETGLVTCETPVDSIPLIRGSDKNCASTGATITTTTFSAAGLYNDNFNAILLTMPSSPDVGDLETQVHEPEHARQNYQFRGRLDTDIDVIMWNTYREAGARLHVIVTAYQNYLRDDDLALWQSAMARYPTLVAVFDSLVRADEASIIAMQAGGDPSDEIMRTMIAAYMLSPTAQNYLHNNYLPEMCMPVAPAGAASWTEDLRAEHRDTTLGEFNARLAAQPLRLSARDVERGLARNGNEYLGTEVVIDPRLVAGMLQIEWGGQTGTPAELRRAAIQAAGLADYTDAEGHLDIPAPRQPLLGYIRPTASVTAAAGAAQPRP